MERESIYLSSGGKEDIKSCAYLMLKDAVESGKVRFYKLSEGFENDEIYSKYNNAISRNDGSLCSFDEYFVPKLDHRKQYVIYLTENHPLIKNIGYFDRLKKKYDVVSVLLFRNMFRNILYPGAQGRHLDDLKKEYDLIVTDEYEDAKKYGLFYAPDTFSSPFKETPEIKYDLTFIGDDKGRGRIIKQTALSAKRNGIHINFKIPGAFSFESSLVDYVPYMSYAQIIYENLESNCILEVLQPGQTSMTLRTQEAVCLKKKLLTNNIHVVKEKFYDSRYIQVFERVDDIDWDFVKRKECVNYENYRNEFSSIDFFDRMDAKVGKMQGGINHGDTAV